MSEEFAMPEKRPPALVPRLVYIRKDQANALRRLAQEEGTRFRVAGHPPTSRVLRKLLDRVLGTRPPRGFEP